MRAVIDTSSLVSLARAGLLGLLDTCGLEFVLLDVVWTEAVEVGSARGFADATAIEARIGGWPVEPGPVATTVDEAVVRAASAVGLVITNDLALGRRARNLGASWLRTVDLVVLSLAAGQITREVACSAVVSLRDAGRISPPLAAAYLQEMS